MKQSMGNILKKINEKKEIIYLTFLSIYLMMTILDLNTVLGESKNSFIISIIKYMCLAGIMVKILVCDVKQYDKKTYIKIAILLILSCIVSFVSNNRIFVQYIILILGAYKIPFGKIVKYALMAEGIIVLIIILLSLINVIPNRIFGRSNSDAVRYSLGFKYATYPSIYVWYFSMLYLYIRKNKIKWWEYTILLIINAIFYAVTDSRNELICSIAIIVLVILFNKIENKRFEKILQLCAKYLMVFCTIISIILAFAYNPQNELMKKTNSILSDRLNLANKALNDYGIKIFGNKINWVGLSLIHYGDYNKSQFNYVDISYLNILINYGIIALALILYGFYRTTDKEIKKGNSFICCFMIIIAIHSIIDPQLFQIVYNIFILLFVNLIVSEKETNSVEEMESK